MSSSSTNSTGHTGTLFGLPLPSLNFGNNIIDVSSLTTLIGSTVGESLVLGSRGPAGIAWSSTSSFGLLWIIRGCINGASPGWLREVIGIRSGVSDSSLGMELNWYSIRSKAIRKSLTQAIGIVCDSGIEGEGEKAGKLKSLSIDNAREVYVFDRLTANKIKIIPETREEPIRIFAYADYVYHRSHDTNFQVVAIGLSSLKLFEAVVLLICDAPLLAAITTLPWAYFFFAAIALEVHETRLKRKPEPHDGDVDIITGTLPTVTRPGGPKKIILGLSTNPKSLWLRLIWGIGSILCMISLAMSYFIMGQQNQGVSFVWICFQALWMSGRMVLHYVADFEDPHGSRSLAEKIEDSRRPSSWRHRILRLTIAVAKYQTLVHPRSEFAYKNDCYSVEKLSLLTEESLANFFPTLPSQVITALIEVHIVQIVGDTLLSSAAWVEGSKLSPMEVYDSCVVTFSVAMTLTSTDVEEPARLISIPAARVYTYESPSSSGEDSTGIREYIPKGTSNPGVNMYWWYFVPAADDKWLVMKRAAEMGIGKCEGRIMSNSQLTKQLLSGQLNVDIKDVHDVQRIVDTSRTVCMSLLQLIASI